MDAKYYKTVDGLFVKLIGDKTIFASDTGLSFNKGWIGTDNFINSEDYFPATESDFENAYRPIHGELVEAMSMAKDITES